MNCVRNSYSGHMFYIRTFIQLCSSWGLLHWRYQDDTTAQILPLSRIVESPLGTRKALLFLGRAALCQKSPRYPGWAVAGLPSITHLPPHRLSGGCTEFPRQMGGSRTHLQPDGRGPNRGTSLMRGGHWRQAERSGEHVFAGVSWLYLSQMLLQYSIVQLVPKPEYKMEITGVHDATSGKLPTPWLESPVL